MPLEVYWDNDEKTIIRSEGQGAWTWEEYHKALLQIVEMMKSVNHRVDSIHLARKDAVTPAGSSLPHFQRAIQIMPPNAGLTVMVNTSPFGRMIVNMFARVYKNRPGSRILMVATLEEARAAIMKDRAKRASV